LAPELQVGVLMGDKSPKAKDRARKQEVVVKDQKKAAAATKASANATADTAQGKKGK
jgi:hypothetical protein